LKTIKRAVSCDNAPFIQKYRATISFTSPTAYRTMGADLSSLRAAVSAGETLPAPVYEAWLAKTGKPMLDGIGATEMLHIIHLQSLRRFQTGRHRHAGERIRS
jgi:2-aminobenzoate-CoA ligase